MGNFTDKDFIIKVQLRIIKNNKKTIEELRKENKELKEALGFFKDQDHQR